MLFAEPTAVPSDQEQLAPDAAYQTRIADFGQQSDLLDRQSARNANLNVALFIATLALTGISIWRGGAWWWLALMVALGFVGSFVHHIGVDAQLQRARNLVAINTEGRARLRRDWAQLPLRGKSDIDPQHPFANDLDVLGNASLQHLLNSATSTNGQAHLREFLLQPADPVTIRLRQSAVRELAPRIDLRDDVAVFGLQLAEAHHTYLAFADWAEARPWLADRPWLVWAARLLPLPTLILLGAQLVGWVQPPVWLLLAIFNLIFWRVFIRPAAEQIEAMNERRETFMAYAGLLRTISEQTYAAAELQGLRERLLVAGEPADQAMHRLARIIPAAEFRRWLFFPIIQSLTLWDVHLLGMLEVWQRTVGVHVRDWLAAAGDFEALAALATLAHDHPSWSFPTITPDAPPQFAAQDLSHPLLPPADAVGNDVAVGPTGTFLFVTGSNMSGKSTLLRAIGTNAILAQMGAPVAARALQMTPMVLATSMRVQDSLEQGVSYFMAELRRLKIVIDLVDATQADSPGAASRLNHKSTSVHSQTIVLYLLDEILHGTNTRERQIAAREIIRHLVGQGAIGAVSTHDLTLVDSPDLAAMSQPVHFTETLTRVNGKTALRFDYRLRPGIATSSNALALMEIVGLPVPQTVAE